MARESKRIRDEKRFGKPERMADLVDGATWFPPADGLSWESGPKTQPRVDWEKRAEWMADGISRSPVFVIDNVAEYVFGNKDQDFKWADLPRLCPPFERFWMECKRPDHINTLTGPIDGTYPDLWGTLFVLIDVANAPVSAQKTEFFQVIRKHLGADINRTRWVLWTHTVCCRKTVMIGPVSWNIIPISDGGELVGSPRGYLYFSQLYENQDRLTGTSIYAYQLLYPALLSLAFLGCKNVKTQEVDPDVRLNRVRRKHGHKPFVRFHTINIDPMKKVLRTEGQSESTGLKRALHICRGHFSTYSEEKPLFGRVAGTFWIPSHVRGTVKEGVVISDYRVSPHGGSPCPS